MRLSRTRSTFAAPIVEAKKWLNGVSFPTDRPLIDLSQAAPLAPPPEAMRAHMAELILTDTNVHLYGPVLGAEELRAELAVEVSDKYQGQVRASQVAITSGCNEAFAATIAALTGQGDEVFLPTPWYFNHKMYLDMSGVTAVPLPAGPELLPDPDHARALITPRTRAIALVSPNNPAGVEYPPPLISAFMELANAAGIKLILDETYRDFLSTGGAPHALFAQSGWEDTLVHLYSFSKAYRLTGHRIGAIAASEALLLEIEKFLDTVTICPGQIGQRAAIWGIRHLKTWLKRERREILDRRSAITEGMARIADTGWRLRGAGACFAYVEHPFDAPADAVARRLVQDASLLTLPATMFTPAGDPAGARHLRLAFANSDRSGLETVIRRLAAVTM